MGSTRPRDLAWIAVPLVLYLFVLQHLWFNAPVWDDYDAILDSVMHLMDAPSAKEWLGIVVAQHNEHRIAVMRLAARAVAAIFGEIDFRILVLIGNFAVVGIFALAWAEFRDAVAAPLFAAAAFLMFQWSYYEATLMGSAALPNIGVVFFSFASLFFAMRGRGPAAAACVLFGILAVGSQANGLFALPMAAAACVLTGKRERAWLFGSVALTLWVLYFWEYSRPTTHPSVTAAFTNPLAALQLFLIVIGGIVPGRWAPIPAGIAILVAIAWLARRGLWKSHPTAALWIAFVLVSAAAATAGRVGFGVFHASRYAIYSTCLVVLVFLAACMATRPWKRATVAFAIVASALVSFAVSWASWPSVLDYSVDGHLLAKAVPASPDVSVERYFGMLHPSHEWSTRILLAAEQRGLYSPRAETVQSPALRAFQLAPPSARLAGYVDDVRASGSRVIVTGWSDIPATVPGRTLALFSSEGAPARMHLVNTERADVAKFMRDPRLLFSGFRLEADYASEALAGRIAESACIVVDAPGHPVTVLGRTTVSCPPAPAR